MIQFLIFLVAAVVKVGSIAGSMAIRLFLPGSFSTGPTVHSTGGSRCVLLIGIGVLLFRILMLASLVVLILIFFHIVKIYVVNNWDKHEKDANKSPSITANRSLPPFCPLPLGMILIRTEAETYLLRYL